MRPGYQKKAVLWGAPGLVFHETGYLFGHLTAKSAPVEVLAAIGIAGLLGTVALMIGFAYYAKGKGRSAAWCLLALIGIFGVIGLMLLSDQAPEGQLVSSTTA